MSPESSDVWIRLRELGADLQDALALARGPERLELGAVAVREAGAALQGVTGPEADAARALLCALDAAHGEITG